MWVERFLLDYPNQVFREVVTMEDSYIVPSSQAVALIISENVQNGVGVRELRDKLFKATWEKLKYFVHISSFSVIGFFVNYLNHNQINKKIYWYFSE